MNTKNQIACIGSLSNIRTAPMIAPVTAPKIGINAVIEIMQEIIRGCGKRKMSIPIKVREPIKRDSMHCPVINPSKACFERRVTESI